MDSNRPNSGNLTPNSSPAEKFDGEDSVNNSDSINQPETRAERLARIRREIAAGTYETPEKLEIALSRMLGVITE